MIHLEAWYKECATLPQLENQILREYASPDGVSDDSWRELAIQVGRVGVLPPKLLKHPELFEEMVAEILDDVRGLLPEPITKDLLKRLWKDQRTWPSAEDYMLHETGKIADTGDVKFFEEVLGNRRTWKSDALWAGDLAVTFYKFTLRARLISWGAKPGNANSIAEKFMDSDLSYHHDYGSDLYLFDSLESLEEAATNDWVALQEDFRNQSTDIYEGDDFSPLDWRKEDHNWAVIDLWSDVAKIPSLHDSPFWDNWWRLYQADTEEEIREVIEGQATLIRELRCPGLEGLTNGCTNTVPVEGEICSECRARTVGLVLVDDGSYTWITRRSDLEIALENNAWSIERSGPGETLYTTPDTTQDPYNDLIQDVPTVGSNYAATGGTAPEWAQDLLPRFTYRADLGGWLADW